MITRREMLATTAAVAGAAALGLPAFAQNVSTAVLMQPGPLGDVWQGADTAKVTIVEYASLTCSHCAHFHETTWPELKKRWVDTGQVRFTLREFPLDPLATAGFMLARADGAPKYYPVTDLLFETQRSWAFTQKPLDALRQTMRQAGFSQERFDAILKDQKLYDAVNAVKNRAAETFKVDSTPTFFITASASPARSGLTSSRRPSSRSSTPEGEAAVCAEHRGGARSSFRGSRGESPEPIDAGAGNLAVVAPLILLRSCLWVPGSPSAPRNDGTSSRPCG